MANSSWGILDFERTISVNEKHEQIPEIRQRLIIMGDLKSSFKNKSNKYDVTTQRAIYQFQWRHGLQQSGIIDKETISALNIPPYEKLNILISSMKKWSQYSDKNNNEYILVNIPEYKLHLMQGGKEQISMKVITGTKKNPTPELDSNITTIVFNPTWNVPESIITKEIAGFMQKDSQYLTKNKISVYSDWEHNSKRIDPIDIDWTNIENNGTDFRFTQSSGRHNVLGKVKFLFKNSHDVYLHDTQNKSLFNTTTRTYSHGCVRVQDPLLLAQYLLVNNRKGELNAFEETSENKKTKYVNLSRKIPIHITYITAWVDEYGIIHFRNNIYNEKLY
tara:strand:+ start:5386 stop:6387 length:1002 start_codon:yes stop_codon:yes gene_type:complete